ncbi:MAG: hypothetical protein V4773_19500, partial [Verrucomicrobiota bacterium]
MHLRLLAPLLAASVGSTLLAADPAASAKGRDAGALYGEFCANCHGAKLEGGKGGNLLGKPWKHG